MSIDSLIDEAIEPVASALASIVFYAAPLGEGQAVPLILLWLVAVALFFTVYLGFINFRYFRFGIDLVRGKYDDPDSDGQINRFQALSTTLSGTVGLGNIAGVALAVSVGGPGAVLWMVLMGLFGMSPKFAEATLGIKYRRHNDPANPSRVSGGPMYYLRDGFAKRGYATLGKGLASFFAVCCVGAAFGAGNMFQANQAYRQAVNITGGETSVLADLGWLFGLFLAALVGCVIIGGIRSIASAASRIVPIMGGLYLLSGFLVILIHAEAIPEALYKIFTMAFVPEAGLGGFLGAFLTGVQRAVFSNEAGTGSAAIGHSAARTDQPVSQGFVAMLGPFIDTVIICLTTGLVIVVTGAYTQSEGMEGVALTSRAFESGISWFPYILSVTVFLFAFSTMISWSYYGLKCTTYLLGESRAVDFGYKLTFCVFVVIGTSASLGNILLFSDSMYFLMAIPNVIGLYVLAPEVKKDLREYLASLRSVESGNEAAVRA